METQHTDRQKHILIIGGGFAGINLCLKLSSCKAYRITLIDRNNYNYFTPLLYQVATSFLEPSSISYPFRQLLRGKRVDFIMGSLKSIDAAAKQVSLASGEILSYDELILAAGAKTNFFGNPLMEQNSLSIKGIDDALYMRNTLLMNLERASQSNDAKDRELLMTIVITGGGPTGVEIAGMLAEMKKNILRRDYPQLKGTNGALYLVDGGKNLLAAMSEKTHIETLKALTNLGVKVIPEARVTAYENRRISFADGSSLEAGTLIWAAGITANFFEGIPESSIGPGKRILTDGYNRITGMEGVWAIGDICISMAEQDYPKGHPQLAQVAIQQGSTLAQNFRAQAKGMAMKPFKYFDRGEMAIVGRHNAVVDLFKHRVHLRGFLALILWLFIHVFSLLSVSNKLRTLHGWALAYLINDQSLRLIFRSERQKED